jgi:hypothetical protein
MSSVEWAPGSFLGANQRSVNRTCYLQVMLRPRMMKPYLYLSIHLQDIAFELYN